LRQALELIAPVHKRQGDQVTGFDSFIPQGGGDFPGFLFFGDVAGDPQEVPRVDVGRQCAGAQTTLVDTDRLCDNVE